MMQDEGREGLPANEPSTWLVRILSLVFIGLGLLFVFAPGAGAGLFGLPAPDWPYIGYALAIGLRDLAFGLYLLILSFMAGKRALAFIFAATVLIPLGDMIIVTIERGISAPAHLLLHGASAAVMTAMSLWLFRQASQHKQHLSKGGTPS